MAKARKRMKESSVQTEQTKTDAVTTVADLTGGKCIMWQCKLLFLNIMEDTRSIYWTIAIYDKVFHFCRRSKRGLLEEVSREQKQGTGWCTWSEQNFIWTAEWTSRGNESKGWNARRSQSHGRCHQGMYINNFPNWNSHNLCNFCYQELVASSNTDW